MLIFNLVSSLIVPLYSHLTWLDMTVPQKGQMNDFDGIINVKVFPQFTAYTLLDEEFDGTGALVG